jgi:hypothetical protein
MPCGAATTRFGSMADRPASIEEASSAIGSPVTLRPGLSDGLL